VYYTHLGVLRVYYTHLGVLRVYLTHPGYTSLYAPPPPVSLLVSSRPSCAHEPLRTVHILPVLTRKGGEKTVIGRFDKKGGI